MEVITGKGVLGQLGLDTVAVKGPLLSGLLFLTVAGLVGGWTVIQNPPDVNKVRLLGKFLLIDCGESWFWGVDLAQRAFSC